MVGPIRVLAKLYTTFRLIQPIAIGDENAPANSVEVEIVGARAVVVAKVIQIQGLIFDRFIRGIRAKKLLLVIRAIEVMRVDNDGPRVKGVDVPVFTGPHQLSAVERA